MKFLTDVLTLRRSRDAYSSIVSAASCLPCRRYRAARLRSVVVTVGLTITDTLLSACTVHQLNAHISAANLIRDHPGEPVPEENFWTLWCKGRLTEAHTDHPTARHSIRTNQCPAPPSPHFFTGRMPFVPPNQQCQSTEGN